CDLERMVKTGRFRADLFYRLQVVPMEVPPLRERAGDIPALAEHFVALAARTHGLPAISFSTEAIRAMRTYSWPGNIRELKNLCERLTILCNGQREPLGAENLPLNLRAKPTAMAGGGTMSSLEQNERDMILRALEQCKGNRTHAARMLGISRYTLLYRIKKHFPGELGLPRLEQAF
ncbi:Transcriptional regulatory protein, partial [sediment metagenome]